MKSRVSNSFTQTQQFGEEFGKTLRGGNVVCMYGNLGAGKTTFVQGLAKGLGVKGRIISPTFIIVRKYEINGERSKKDFYHVDLYRIEESTDFQSLGLDEILNDRNSVVAIEWAEKLGSSLPKDRIDIYFENLEGDTRKITWNK